MSEGYSIHSLAEIEAIPYHQQQGQKLIPVQLTLDYRAAGVNGWFGDPGELLVPEHDEDSDEELYVVVQGRATFTVEGETFDAPAGTLVHVPAKERRTAVAAEPETIVLVVGGTQGVAPGPSGWTPFVVADAHRRAGRMQDARRAVQAMLASTDLWFAPYNAACFEALAGDPDAAFSYLEEAFRRDADAARGYAPNDDDLISLRDDPRWPEVTR
jgi:quercetin dioxygenase-like cupin family protein